jgi:hypothetical protein
VRRTIDDLATIVGTFDAGGFKGYATNFRRALATDHMPDGHFLEAPKRGNPLVPRLTHSELEGHQAQHSAPGYSYLAFCKEDEPPEPRSAGQTESDHRALQRIERASSSVMAAIEDRLDRLRWTSMERRGRRDARALRSLIDEVVPPSAKRGEVHAESSGELTNIRKLDVAATQNLRNGTLAQWGSQVGVSLNRPPSAKPMP